MSGNADAGAAAGEGSVVAGEGFEGGGGFDFRGDHLSGSEGELV